MLTEACRGKDTRHSLIGSQGHLEPIPGSIGANPPQGTQTHTHSPTHPPKDMHGRLIAMSVMYEHYRHANQPTMHIFGLSEETRVPRGNYTHGHGGNRTPNPGGMRQTC
ncbi:hypothetical protein AMELA_G00147720 [Ameiurus melas]|uniref:Uncharacterized protein n=1 Tax=Ameiurus melas TaxID=219545 RepID=A0A7J6AGN5_AMEME|nr:hypothetical protein AMELA_G00147720 [Ameiurus melas]